VDWPALEENRRVYQALQLVAGGMKILEAVSSDLETKRLLQVKVGYTGCAVVSPDVQVQYANSGPGLVHNLFDSAAYDASKFSAMLDRGLDRFAQEQRILKDSTRNEQQRVQKLAEARDLLKKVVEREGAALPTPKGFTDAFAQELGTLGGFMPPKIRSEKE
jgi:hypothetical protein